MTALGGDNTNNPHSHADPTICRELGCDVDYDPRPSGPVSDERLLQEVWDRGLQFRVKVHAAIPEPLYVGWRLKKSRCHCGEVFRKRVQYRGHYALAHILGRV